MDGGKASACKKQQGQIWGVRTRELVAQALGCELGSLGWSRARYRASQTGRQQGCGQHKSVNSISISSWDAATTSPRGSETQIEAAHGGTESI